MYHKDTAVAMEARKSESCPNIGQSVRALSVGSLYHVLHSHVAMVLSVDKGFKDICIFKNLFAYQIIYKFM